MNKNPENQYLVVMAGGVGSRFWPLSTFEKPKQFIDVLGIGKTLFQETVERFSSFCPIENVFVVTSYNYSGFVREQMPGIPEENILAEPMRRNTAPCIAYACYKIQEINPDAIIVVSPSDHFVKETFKFREIIDEGVRWLESNKGILTMGIQPNRPETGYGYIHFNNDNSDGQALPVLEFKEKPDEETAKKYLDSGDYFWNAGIFIWHVNTIVESFKKHLPEVDRLFENINDRVSCRQDLETIYEKAPEISIDYGILEHASNIYVLLADCGWTDLGTWNSLWMQEEHDDKGNSITGNKTHVYNSANCIIRVQENKEIIIEGLEEYIVVDDPEHLLICRKTNEQAIGRYSKNMQKDQN